MNVPPERNIYKTERPFKNTCIHYFFLFLLLLFVSYKVLLFKYKVLLYKQMPRVSLPSTLKNLQTYEVLLTKTTESDIRSHFKEAYATFEQKIEKYKKRIYDAVGIFIDGNPYANKDWKVRPPTRHYKESLYWFGDDEVELREYMNMSILLADLKRLEKHFDWEELEEMVFEAESFINYMTTGQNDLKTWEELRFNQAKKTFQEENKEWIEEQRQFGLHKQTHIGGYLIWSKEDQGENIDQYLECVFCKAAYEKEKANMRLFRENMQKSALTNYTPDPEEEEEVKPHVKPVQQVCEDCGFKSFHKFIFDDHKNDSQHKRAIQLKAWNCKECEIQCRTEIEFKNHIQSNKHKKKIGEIAVPEYVCEKCNYKTLLKHLFEQHCSTKKHIEQV